MVTVRGRATSGFAVNQPQYQWSHFQEFTLDTIALCSPRSVFLVIAAAVCSSVSAPAQLALVFGESDKIAIEKMYDRYLLAFISKDYAALRDCVQAPFVVLAGGDIQTLSSVDDVMTFYRKQIVALEQRNYDHAEITNTRITALTPDSALLNKSIRRFKKDGSVLEEGAAIYPACKSSGAWKLCGMMRQESQYFGKVY